MAPDDENLLHLIVHSVQNNKSARCADSKQLMKVKLSGKFASGYLSIIRYDMIRGMLHQSCVEDLNRRSPNTLTIMK